jgi:hypothetical protein
VSLSKTIRPAAGADKTEMCHAAHTFEVSSAGTFCLDRKGGIPPFNETLDGGNWLLK